MIVESARCPEFKDNKTIKLLVKFKELDEEVPFLAAPNDSYHDVDIYEEALKGTYGVVSDYVPDLTLLKDKKYREVKAAYAIACCGSVATEKGEFNGGLSSSLAIFNAVELSEYLKESSVSITDVNNVEISCSMDEARSIASSIGVAYRSLFYKKQKLMVAIESATSVSKLETLKWEE